MSRKTLPTSILLFACACCLVTNAQTSKTSKGDPQTARIQELIEQLGDNSYHRRQAAEWELERIGLPAFEQLREACHKHPNIQVAVAARYLVNSQKVMWWLETDRLSVRQVLRDYNDQPDTERMTTIQELADDGSSDALMALCRLARYESSEKLSKIAAISLMEEITESPDRLLYLPAIQSAAEDSTRKSCVWLQVMCSTLQNGDASPGVWQQLVLDEHRLLEATPKQSSDQVILRLYRWIGTLISKSGQHELAIQVCLPSLDVIGNRPMHAREVAIWALDSGLPELVPELEKRFPKIFGEEPELGYLLAESYLKSGDQAKLEETLVETRASVTKGVKNLGKLPNMKAEDLIARQHVKIGKTLQEERGMFEWAAVEYEFALNAMPSFNHDVQLRDDISQFYFEGENFDRACEVLKPVIDRIESNPNEKESLRTRGTLGTSDDLEYLYGNYYYYLGMRELAKKEHLAAFDHLKEAVDRNPDNPDFVIAMQLALAGVDKQDSRHQLYQAAFSRMLQEYREQIQAAERELAGADRVQRSTREYQLAQNCNQLAWLLSKTNNQPLEAVRLSKRSLELMPDYAVFQDTLARCYFAAGDVELAVQTQAKAVKNEPHQRTMMRQLAEFRAVLEQSTKKN